MALLCIDLQNMPPTTARQGVDFDTSEVESFETQLPQTLVQVKTAQDYARARGLELVHCRIESRTMDGRDRSLLHRRMGIHVPPGSAQWLPGVEPEGDEIVFNKTGSNAFCCTNIEFVLKNLQITTLVCCGVLTDECVAGTVKAASDLGYNCLVLTDACQAAVPERHTAALKTLSRFATLSTTDEWLRGHVPAVFRCPTESRDLARSHL